MKNNLIEKFFDKGKTFSMGIFCTYSLNLNFFEDYLLILDGVASCTNLSVFTDRNVYNSHFDKNASARPKWINKKYLVTPIDTQCVFHPKLYILASEKEVRIGVGSANLTREGLSSNFEIVSIFEISEKDLTYCVFLKECLDFVKDLAIQSQSSSALDSVNSFIDFVEHLFTGSVETPVHLLHNLNKPIITQVVEELGNIHVEKIKVISPFYDRQLRVHDYLKKTYPTAKIDIYLQQGKSNFPRDEYKPDDSTDIYMFKDESRFIHGKALVFDTVAGTFLLMGSANYTKEALLSSHFDGNVETAVWGKINKEDAYKLFAPCAQKPRKLEQLRLLETTPIQNEVTQGSKEVDIWLIEAHYDGDQIVITLNDKSRLEATSIIFNGDDRLKRNFQTPFRLGNLKKSELEYVQIEGFDLQHNLVVSGKVWIIDLENSCAGTSKKRFCVNDPSQITKILLDIILRGSEQELIEYLLLFNIPLDLVGLKIGIGPGAHEGQGNLFGELKQQDCKLFTLPGIYDAVEYCLMNNMNKLCEHKRNLQLNKLDNFMLIYGTTFNMMKVFNDYILTGHPATVVSAQDWAVIRDYYDLMLKFIHELFSLLWDADNEFVSLETLVNESIIADNQQMLGNIKSFKEYIERRNYGSQYQHDLMISIDIINSFEIYMQKSKISTTVGTIVPPIISVNGSRDNSIRKRKNIYARISELKNEYDHWKKFVKN